ncbi:MAG: hypothetical protein Q8S58_17490 [Bosea sp. (in: a-proteobacteria)]|uniref:hypothetical protein n=1 Tax=Bosea sp. (in: a-proteobacteria) TaxID=1871050 RepID=UPI0027346C75|nr:hypothetical protein [Bosea sp. (in: a-proteobacteria)]MDP3255017.1 hypothetical protein [Bosea sp. (in: a-proteobacteria)]MDP3320921.1 hypothetical protein [Bosea sp. (in: a-proteobacteria)]
MKKSIAVLAFATSLAACSSPPRPPVGEMPQATPTKRIAIVGSEVVLPDGSRSTMDAAGGFVLPNGERVRRDGRGALVLPNGNRCLPDGTGYVCP